MTEDEKEIARSALGVFVGMIFGIIVAATLAGVTTFLAQAH